jgi:hypothetical protein
MYSTARPARNLGCPHLVQGWLANVPALSLLIHRDYVSAMIRQLQSRLDPVWFQEIADRAHPKARVLFSTYN